MKLPRFHLRDLFALTVIAGVTCGVGRLMAADNPEELFVVFALFVFGALCYVVGANRVSQS